MLKRPEVLRDTMDPVGLSYRSAHQWCLFLAEEATFNGGDPSYWMSKAESYDPSVCGFVWSAELEAAISKYPNKQLSSCTEKEGSLV